MILWLDAQLPPQLAPWLRGQFAITAFALRELGLRDATDAEIFQAAREQRAVVMTKDRDFVALIERYGAPPQVIWRTCGNTATTHLRALLIETLPRVFELLAANERIVEIRDL